MFINVSGSFTEAILCSISEPAIIYDSDIRVVWTNPSAEMFFGHSTEFMAGKKCSDLFPGILECFDNCPVEKSLATERDEVLVVDGVVYPHKLIETIPYDKDGEKFVLAIIHSVPEIDRNKALRRNFAARLNKSGNLKDSAPDIVNAIKSLASVSCCGVYVRSGNRFSLLLGNGVPEFLTGIDLTSPSYLSGEKLPFDTDGSYPDGAAIIPVVAPGGITEMLLFAGRGTMSTKFRSRLEMIASVLAGCINRLTSAL
ncbi:MAG: PAS domain S-box protein [Candidatus Sabulitectum sp.]|nr:PAS domain S-box protein [Candidatus Sabulitectum sp.]